jgi:hypothetical protein
MVCKSIRSLANNVVAVRPVILETTFLLLILSVYIQGRLAGEN